MDERMERTLRRWTFIMSGLSCVATVVLLLVWVPTAAQAEPGYSFRPMALAPFLLVCFVGGGLPGLLIGFCQLWWRPRVYGLLSLVAGCAPYAAFQLTNWLLLDLRGISVD